MRLEDELRDALRASEPPDGFDRRVLERLEAHRAARSAPPPMSSGARWKGRLMAIAASVTVVMASGWYYEHRAAEERGARAAQNLRAALYIASEKLTTVQRRVNGSEPRE